jgi:hypothetical protein
MRDGLMRGVEEAAPGEGDALERGLKGTESGLRQPVDKVVAEKGAGKARDLGCPRMCEID